MSIIPPPTKVKKIDTFDNSSNNYTLTGGQTSPNELWNCFYASGGLVTVRPSLETTGAGKVMDIDNPTPSSIDTTKSTNIILTKDYANFDMHVDIRTIAQTATPFRNPNRWEVAWIVFRFTDDYHWYWVMTYSDGHMEMGRKDYSTPIEAQIFLVQNNQVVQKFVFGKWYDYNIK